jgi:hypothetical protein
MDTSFHEAGAELKTQEVPYCHLSVELDHLYMEDYLEGRSQLPRRFAQLVPWFAATVEAFAARHAVSQPRVSTCFLIDDYFSRFSSPAELIPKVLAAADREGLRIDYVARESACAGADGTGPADLTLGRLVTEPVAGTTGGRPPLTQTGWLTNGERSPSTARTEAMSKRRAWQPPSESARRRHSIFIDVELWDERDGGRTWSCAMLAAVWQLMRLGLLRNHGRPVVTPQDWMDAPFPDSWDDLPPVTRLNRRAAAFSAYTTLSVLSPRFLPVELAVRTILSQFAGDNSILAETGERAARDAIQLPADLVDRIRYVLTAPGETDPA